MYALSLRNIEGQEVFSKCLVKNGASVDLLGDPKWIEQWENVSGYAKGSE